MTAAPPRDRAAERQAQLRERAALLARLLAMPAAMRDKPQWLLWRFIAKAGAAKPAKVPFYANGQLRGWPAGKPKDGKPTEAQPQVEQGHPRDREALVPLQVVIDKLRGSMHWAGAGFAFLPGDGLIGIDIDHQIDPDTGEISELCSKVIELCGSYAEWSPSRKGAHVIVAGESHKNKDDLLGLELYSNGQYFTCTGDHWAGTPTEVQTIDPGVLAYLHELIDASKAQQVEAKRVQAELDAAARPAVARPAPARPPASPPVPARSVGVPASPSGAGDDFRRVNEAAQTHLQAWVPMLFSEAVYVPGKSGYRVTSKALGRDLQEDIWIMPSSIVDFGVADLGDPKAGWRTPIDLVLEWGGSVGVSKPVEAMRWLADRLGMPLQRPRLRAVSAPAAAPAGAPVAATTDPRPEPPPADGAAPAAKPRKRARRKGDPPATDDAPASGGEGDGAGDGAGDAASDAAPARGGRRRKVHPPEFWELVDTLSERFALIYSTDQAWDRWVQLPITIGAMRLAFGKDAVAMWLARPSRVMVLPTDLVFEPGQAVPDPQINMFSGLVLQPEPCTAEDVAPMLKLLRHLCAESATSADEVDEVIHQILCWQALPLQQLGTKMHFAIIFHGTQGTGKNLYWDLWRNVYGLYGITVSQTELEDKFNGWISRKLAIIGDEVVSRQEMYHNKNRLKLVVTQDERFPIRDMQQATRWETNHANVVFLSNEPTPLVLEDRDRRYLVIYTPLEADEELYRAVRDFKRNNGAAKWLYYLQQYTVGEFNAHTKPRMTAAKQALIEANWLPSALFCHEWLEGILDLPVRVCSAEQLYRAFRTWCDRTGARWPPDQGRFTREIKRWVHDQVKRDDKTGRLEEVRLTYKHIGLRDAETQVRKTVRCWLPRGTGPLNGVTEGDWAWDSVGTFEADLRKFCRSGRPSAKAGDGDDERDGS